MSNEFEKKSERLEVRLPYSKKQAFVEACEQQSDTPSHAVRRFINSYIRRSDTDDLGHSVGVLRRKFFPVFLVAAICLLGVLAVWKFNGDPSQDASSNDDALFAVYDKNENGQLGVGEVLSGENEKYLFQVLDINSDQVIDREEFISEGEIAWLYKADEKSGPIASEDGQSAAINTDGLVTFVQFDLTNTEDPFVSGWVNNGKDKGITFRADQIIYKPRPSPEN